MRLIISIALTLLMAPWDGLAQWSNSGDNGTTGSVSIGGTFVSTANYGLSLQPISGDAIIRRNNSGNMNISSGGGSTEIRLNYSYGGGSGGVLIYDGGSTNNALFKVNGSGHLNISSSGGYVGVGNVAPQFNLDVAGTLRTTSFINAAQYITVQNGGSYRVAMNGQSDGYVTGRNASNQDMFTIASNGASYFNGGNVGIGTTIPYYKLDVVGNLRTSEQISASQYITVDKAGSYRVALNGQADGYIVGRNDAVEDKFVITSNGVSYFNGGNVGIGTTTPGSFKLAVNGKIWTQEVNVAMTNPGPDYVFEPTYNLLPLSEVESYIKANNHLPEVPSAKQMEEEGLNLKEMNLLLLKKVEELTLHLIEMKKESSALTTQNELLMSDIDNLKLELRSIKSSINKK